MHTGDPRKHERFQRWSGKIRYIYYFGLRNRDRNLWLQSEGMQFTERMEGITVW